MENYIYSQVADSRYEQKRNWSRKRSYKIFAYESDSSVNAKVSMRSSFFKCEPWKRW